MRADEAFQKNGLPEMGAKTKDFNFKRCCSHGKNTALLACMSSKLITERYDSRGMEYSDICFVHTIVQYRAQVFTALDLFHVMSHSYHKFQRMDLKL